MPARLVQQTGGDIGRRHPLNPGVTTIGRDEANDIVIAGDHLSRRHAEVRWDGVRFLLLDLESKNGTLLNGERVTCPRLLRGGDTITLPGRPDVALRVVVSEETATLRPEQVRQAGLRIDLHAATVYVDGAAVQVSAKEYRALTLLHERAGGLVRKEDLAAAVWPEYGGAVADYNIEQLISRLRRKLEPDPERPRVLVTVRGLGYRLAPSGQ